MLILIFHNTIAFYLARRPGEQIEAKSLRDTSTGGSSDLNSQRLNSLTLKDKNPMSSSGNECEVSNSSGLLVFEYLEHEQPHFRKPLTDKASSTLTFLVFSCLVNAYLPIKLMLVAHSTFTEQISTLESQFPDLSLYRSCDLMPASWISIAWYGFSRASCPKTRSSLELYIAKFYV